jgi:hypothetical protein
VQLESAGTPQDIALDATNVYWTDSSDGSVRSASKAGGPQTVIATGQGKPVRLTLDSGYVYWSNNLGAAIMRAPADGSGSPQLVAAASSPQGVLVLGATVYWADTGTNSIGYAPKDGSGSPQFVGSPASGSPQELVTDGSTIFVSVPASSSAQPGGVFPLGTSTNLGQYDTGPIAVASGYLYYGQNLLIGNGRELVAVPLNGSGGWSYSRSTGAIAADGCGVFTVVFPYSGSGATLGLLVPTGGALDTLVPVASWATLSPNRIAIDSDSVYWTDSNFIGKAPRP